MGVVIFTMARYYSTEEVLEMVLDLDCEDGSASFSEDSGDDSRVDV